MKKLLITCFEPFGGEAVNASLEAVNRLPEIIGDWTLTKCQVPVVFGKCALPVFEALENETYNAVLLIGQAAGRKAVTPEMFAHNLRFARIPDNAGQTPIDEPIAEGPLALAAAVDVRNIASAILSAGIPAEVSYSAGAYVCNDLYYQVLWHEKSRTLPVCFIHVPSTADGFTYEDLSKAIRTAVLSLPV